MTKDEQIEALLKEGSAVFELVSKEAGKPIETLDGLKEYITVTPKEIVEYAKEHDILRRIGDTVSGSQDGFYILKEGDSYRIFLQEHGGPFDEKTFSNHDEALEAAASRFFFFNDDVDYRYALSVENNREYQEAIASAKVELAKLHGDAYEITRVYQSEGNPSQWIVGYELFANPGTELEIVIDMSLEK